MLRQNVLANYVDPDQTAPKKEQSDPHLQF